MDTPLGRVVTWGVFIYLIASGWIFYILSTFFNLLFVFFLFGPLLAPILLKRQAEQLQEQQRAQQAQQQQYWQQQQSNPYSGWGGGPQGPFGGPQGGPQGWSGAGKQQKSSPDEIIIDVEPGSVEEKKR